MKTKDGEKRSQVVALPNDESTHSLLGGLQATVRVKNIAFRPSANAKMKVHPAMFMKTKERENSSRPTPGNRPGASAAERCGSRMALTLTSGSPILSLTEYPEKFMKTKELKKYKRKCRETRLGQQVSKTGDVQAQPQF